MSDDTYDAQSEHGSHFCVALPSNHSGGADGDRSSISDDNQLAFTLLRVQGRDEQVAVWEEPDDDFNQPQESRNVKVGRNAWSLGADGYAKGLGSFEAESSHTMTARNNETKNATWRVNPADNPSGGQINP